jgi:hypothetical protein
VSIALDTSSVSALVGPGATSLTWPHTCTGSNLILWVGVFGDSASGTITGVTYNGVSMTQAPTVSPIQVPSDRFIYLFYLIAPATGTHDIVVTAGTGTYIAGVAASYTGAKQTGVPDASTNNSGFVLTGDFTCTLTTVANNSWTVFIAKNDANGPTASTGSTQRQMANGTGIYDSNGPLSVGSHSMSVQDASSAASNFAGIMVSVAPSDPPPTLAINFPKPMRPRPFAPGLAR